MEDENNNFHQVRVINQIEIDVQYADSIYQKVKKNSTFSIPHVFYIRIASLERNDEFDIVSNNNYDYFSFSFEKNINIETNNKIYPCDIFYYEQSHGKSGELYFVVGFDMQNQEDDIIKLVVNPEPLQTGPIKFIFDLTKKPKVK